MKRKAILCRTKGKIKRRTFCDEVVFFQQNLKKSIDSYLKVDEILEDDLVKIIVEEAQRLVYCIGSSIFKKDSWLNDFIDKYDLLNHPSVIRLNNVDKSVDKQSCCDIELLDCSCCKSLHNGYGNERDEHESNDWTAIIRKAATTTTTGLSNRKEICHSNQLVKERVSEVLNKPVRSSLRSRWLIGKPVQLVSKSSSENNSANFITSLKSNNVTSNGNTEISKNVPTKRKSLLSLYLQQSVEDFTSGKSSNTANDNLKCSSYVDRLLDLKENEGANFNEYISPEIENQFCNKKCTNQSERSSLIDSLGLYLSDDDSVAEDESNEELNKNSTDQNAHHSSVQDEKYFCNQIFDIVVPKEQKKKSKLPRSKPRLIDMGVYTAKDKEEDPTLDLTRNGTRSPDQPQYIGDDFQVPDRVMELYEDIIATRDLKTFEEPTAHQLRLEMIEADNQIMLELQRFSLWQESISIRRKAEMEEKQKNTSKSPS